MTQLNRAIICGLISEGAMFEGGKWSSRPHNGRFAT